MSRGSGELISSSLVVSLPDFLVFSEAALLGGEQVGRLLRAYNRAVAAGLPSWIELLSAELGCCTEELTLLQGHQFGQAEVPTREMISQIGFWMLEQDLLERILLYENLVGVLPQRFLRE